MPCNQMAEGSPPRNDMHGTTSQLRMPRNQTAGSLHPELTCMVQAANFRVEKPGLPSHNCSIIAVEQGGDRRQASCRDHFISGLIISHHTPKCPHGSLLAGCCLQVAVSCSATPVLHTSQVSPVSKHASRLCENTPKRKSHFSAATWE